MQPPAQKKTMMAHGGEGVRQRICRIERERAFEQHERVGHLRRHPGIDVRLRLQDKVVSIEAVGPFALHALEFGAPQAGLDGADHVQGNLVLKRENVIERTIETLGPQMSPGLRLYHLSRDADTTAILTHASL